MAFARKRVGRIEDRYDEIAAAEPGLEASEALARALTQGGYAASVRQVPVGEQLCQQHCPVCHVAHEFPQFCEAETEVISKVLGRHVQRLATIAHGDGVCTTCIPSSPHERVSTMTTSDLRPDLGTIDERNPELEGLGRYQFGWSDSDTAGATAKRGLSEEVVRDISAKKSEPQWMLDLRLKGLKLFQPQADADLGLATSTGIDFDNIKYFVRSTEKQAATWDDLPADIKNTYDKLGIPEAEKQRLVCGCRRAVRVRGRLPPDPRGPGGAGCDLHRHRHRMREHPDLLPPVLRHDYSADGQQVRYRAGLGHLERWLVHLRAQGCED